MRVFIDTNVYLDLLLNRDSSLYAEQIITRSISCEFYVIVSPLIIQELENYANEIDIKSLFERIGVKKIFVHTSKKKEYVSGLHFPDNIHLHTAIEANCDVFLTNDHAFFDISSSIQILSSRIF